MRRHAPGVLALVILFQLFGKSADALVGADLVDISVQRYTVAVASSKGRCTGVVLAQDVVLTAAHCTQDTQNLWVGGDQGWGDLTNPPVGLSRVSKAIQHPSYKPKQFGSPDLAVLKLEKPLPDRFVPAYFGAAIPNLGEDLIATGYGQSTENDLHAGKTLRMVLLRLSKNVGGYLALVSVREENSGAGRGDSGGPVFTYHGLHGLVGLIVGHTSRETLAVPIAPNYLWIKDTIEKLNAP